MFFTMEDKMHCALDRLQLFHKTCWVSSTCTGQPDWTVQLNAYTVRVVPARIMQLLGWGVDVHGYKILKSHIFRFNI